MTKKIRMSNLIAKLLELRSKFSTFVHPPCPKEGTLHRPKPMCHVACSFQEKDANMHGKFCHARGHVRVSEGKEAAAFHMPQQASDATTQGRQGTKPPNSAPLPLPGFPVIDSSSQAERLTAAAADVSTSSLKPLCSRLLVQK